MTDAMGIGSLPISLGAAFALLRRSLWEGTRLASSPTVQLIPALTNTTGSLPLPTVIA
jgi:hypothetical protein